MSPFIVMLQQTVQDYTAAISQLLPLHKTVDDLQARLEEFETMLTFVQADAKESRDVLIKILSYKPEFDELCAKIDTIERLVGHVKTNFAGLETEIEKKEAAMGIADTASKVTGIFTPFFKKTMERKQGTYEKPFKTEDYFK
ncbi:biogenesis of lysosome-related organelles complex 1 subunit 4 isoform X2 [Cylas formicarius]|uniref:biogenesis of lysosome-related organelles complex 1 subunit 4 isoform X2 n=1 Tax=Cylas formicarius TaxID=197179 RepID=UPI00295843C0|nr:biogenesis of lysosome-related organelles complex 1 subunit 4 isoform X2 [Cylas formicarius]